MLHNHLHEIQPNRQVTQSVLHPMYIYVRINLIELYNRLLIHFPYSLQLPNLADPHHFRPRNMKDVLTFAYSSHKLVSSTLLHLSEFRSGNPLDGQISTVLLLGLLLSSLCNYKMY